MLDSTRPITEYRKISFPTEGLSRRKGRQWLLDKQSDEHARVTVCWDSDTGLTTTWGIFANWWPTFCYPSSDDVVIFPDSMAWALVFHHDEKFIFGRR